jgi:hypothetical protein
MQALCQLSYSPGKGGIVSTAQTVPLLPTSITRTLDTAHDDRGFSALRWRGHHYGRRELRSRRIAPEAFQVVEAPGRLVENVDDDVAVVEQDPGAVLHAFPSESPAADGRQSLFGALSQSQDMPPRRAAGNQEYIGDDQEVRHIQDDDPQTLLVVDCSGRRLCGGMSFRVQRNGAEPLLELPAHSDHTGAREA